MKKLLLSIAIAFTVLIPKPDNVLAQSCPSVPTNTGTVTLSATTTAGTYRVWSRMKSADTTNNNFYLRVNSTCAVLVGDNTQISSTNWTWVDYQNGNTASKTEVTLTAGTHVITLIGNEPGISVDKILLTKNLTCIPTGVGDNCPAEVPSVTPAPDTTIPLISNVTVANITNTGAEISWNLNEGGTGQIEYGTTTEYGLTTTKENGYLTFHKQTLSGLAPGTLYHYRIRSLDAAGNTALLPDRTFTTTGGISATPTIKPPSPIPTSAPTPIPTVAPTGTPTPSPLPSDTVLRFSSVKLHGIGKGGDNTNPNLNGNLNPLTPSRSFSVELYNTGGSLISTTLGNIVYSAASGIFTGDIRLDESVISGTYLIKVKSDKYIKKQLIGIITINKSSINQMPEVTLVVGDSNGDGTLSILDYNIILDCYSDLQAARNCSDAAKKASADLSDDGKVNQDDYNLLLREMSVITGD